MREKKLKIRVEDTENGDVTELSSNCVVVVTADDAEGDERDVQIFSIGRCRGTEMLACAEALGKAERKMRERVWKNLNASIDERISNLMSEADA